ncbi:MAG: beta-galactosidase [Opitutus sp.]|nr:beta-galactosidase [Opitutus sp.]
MKPVLLLACLLLPLAGPAAELPHLRAQGSAKQLIVDGQPFLVRGGELGNSSAEPDYLRRFWPKLKAMNLNTVVAPIYWDVIEPAEEKFDFAMLDGLLADARAHDMRLVLLWFGSWKNSMSCYAPAWVKADQARFPRAQDSAGRGLEILSPFHPENRDTDARAFTALMRHLKSVDPQHTVIMVQVENEIGMIPEARDRSPEAERAWAAPVPTALMDYLAKHRASLAPELAATWNAAGGKTAGSWAEVFGSTPASEEVFMAWYFAAYVQTITAAGKAELALPMFANAALIRPGYQPGQYPSAGPLPHLIDVWRAAAPALDFIAPDIYFQNFSHWAQAYTRSGNPLFIPEALRSPEAAVNALYAFGQLDAIGFCPFAIESNTEPAAGYLAASFDLVRQLTPLLAEKQGRGVTAGFLQESLESKQPQQVRMGKWIMRASFERAAPPQLADGLAVVIGAENSALAAGGRAGTAPAGGLMIQLGADEFLFAGIGLTITFASTEPGSQAGILSCAEGRYENGEWKHLRWLNGDQTHQGRHVRLEPGRFALQRVKLYRYR